MDKERSSDGLTYMLKKEMSANKVEEEVRDGMLD